MSQPKKGLSLFALTMIAIGASIGSGIFKTPSGIAEKVSDNGTILLLWILGGGVSLLGALVFAEMGSRFSNAGGVYTYLNKAYGSLAGFLYGWCLLIVISSGTIAALCTVFAEYTNVFIGLDKAWEKYLAMGSVVVLTLFNTFGIRLSEWFANIGTVLKIIGIYALLFIALILGDQHILGEVKTAADAALAPDVGNSDNLAGAFVGVLWSFTGWHYASFVAGDAINPKRNIPRALLYGTAAVTLTYVLCNMAYFKALDHATIKGSRIVAADAMAAVIPGSDYFISALVALSVFACAGMYILSTPRIFNQMAIEGLFFKAFSKNHPRFGVPVNAIVLQSIWAIVLIYAWGTFSSIIEYVTFVEWLFLLIACAGIFFIRKKYSDVKPDFRTPLYPLVPIIFILVVGWFITMNAMADKLEYYTGLLVIPLGVIFYYSYRSISKRKK